MNVGNKVPNSHARYPSGAASMGLAPWLPPSASPIAAFSWET